MQLTKQELSLLNYSLQTSGTSEAGQPVIRNFSVGQLKMAIDIFDKLKANTKEEVFVDGELKLTTEEKTFMLGLINRPWSLEDGRVKLELEKKLS